jgi:hypothetical protein
MGSLYGQTAEMTEKILRKEAQTEPLSLPVKKERKYASLKSKVKIKEASSKKNTFPELCIDDKKEVNIPRGLEVSENFSGNVAISDLIKLVGELQLSEKYLGNRGDKDDIMKNTIKYVVGFNWKTPDSPISVEGLLENKAKNSIDMRGLKPVNFKNEGNAFEKVTLKVKLAY